MEHPAGEPGHRSLRVDFDRNLKLEFHGSRITSDTAILVYRELWRSAGDVRPNAGFWAWTPARTAVVDHSARL